MASERTQAEKDEAQRAAHAKATAARAREQELARRQASKDAQAKLAKATGRGVVSV